MDVVGLGLNATDTVIRLPHFPEFNSKVELLSANTLAGGQVASAMVACQRWGLQTRYVGKVGDDRAARFQFEHLARAGVEAKLLSVSHCPSQIAFILIDQPSGERTILWHRDARLEIRREEIRRHWILSARSLLVDGHDTPAAAQAAYWARQAGIPVIADLDNPYSEIKVLLECADYLLTSHTFPEKLTGEKDLLKVLKQIAETFNCRVAGATLGEFGVVAWDGRRFIYCPGFRVRAIDTTGAGDILHAGFVYGLLRGWPLERILEFSCAAAALNCTALGARGGIRPVQEIEEFMREGRRSDRVYSESVLRRYGTD